MTRYLLKLCRRKYEENEDQFRDQNDGDTADKKLVTLCIGFMMEYDHAEQNAEASAEHCKGDQDSLRDPVMMLTLILTCQILVNAHQQKCKQVDSQ